jgi:photosystem II stability/assembly factor-like uncharacterized protein
LDLRSICFPVDAESGYVSGGDPGVAIILKTTNGGRNWTEQTTSDTQPISSIHFPVSIRVGYAVDWQGGILKTTDGGTNWFFQTSNTNASLSCVQFPSDEMIGFAVGSSGTILKTTNGGDTWVRQTSGVFDYISSVSFPAGNVIGYVVGANGKIFKTTNGGQDWVPQNSGSNEFLSAVLFPIDALTGYAVGRNGTILKTADGGAGVEEREIPEASQTGLSPTIVRNILFLPQTLNDKCGESSILFDITGKKVADLQSGTNDIRHLAPGVYFVKQLNLSNIIKVVVAR